MSYIKAFFVNTFSDNSQYVKGSFLDENREHVEWKRVDRDNEHTWVRGKWPLFDGQSDPRSIHYDKKHNSKNENKESPADAMALDFAKFIFKIFKYCLGFVLGLTFGLLVIASLIIILPLYLSFLIIEYSYKGLVLISEKFGVAASVIFAIGVPFNIIFITFTILMLK